MVEEYQTTRHVEEALERLTESYLALGLVQDAQTAAAVLGHNFPDSQWYKDAYKASRRGGRGSVRRTRAPGFPGPSARA